MPSPQTDPLRQAVFEALLHTDNLSRQERKERMDEVCATFDCASVTVYQAIQKVRRGEGLCRQTRSDAGTFRALTPEMFEYLRVQVQNRLYRSVKIIYREMQARYGDRCPSYSTIRAAVKEIERQEQATARALPEKRTFEHVNECWEVDYSKGDFFIADPRHNDGKPIRPPLACLIDGKSRAILWACYSFFEDTELLGQLIYNAIRPKSDHARWPMHGTPLVIRCDNGKVFKSAWGKDMLARLGIQADFGRPHVPQDKPIVERSFGSIHRMFEDTLPGSCGPDNKGDESVSEKTFRQVGGRYVDPRPLGERLDPAPLLTLDEANSALWAWITNTYHQRTHTGIGCSPLEAWDLDVRHVPERLDHNLAILQEVCFSAPEQRMARRGQITFNNITYQHPVLLGKDGSRGPYDGLTLPIRWIPADCRSILVYHPNRPEEFLCEAIAQSADWIHDDVASHREWKKVRQSKAARKKQQQDIIAGATVDDIEGIKRAVEQKEAEVFSIAPKGDEVPAALAPFSPEQREAVLEMLAGQDASKLDHTAIAILAEMTPEEIRTCDFEMFMDIPVFRFDVDAPTQQQREEASDLDDLCFDAAGGDS